MNWIFHQIRFNPFSLSITSLKCNKITMIGTQLQFFSSPYLSSRCSFYICTFYRIHKICPHNFKCRWMLVRHVVWLKYYQHMLVINYELQFHIRKQIFFPPKICKYSSQIGTKLHVKWESYSRTLSSSMYVEQLFLFMALNRVSYFIFDVKRENNNRYWWFH